MHRHNALDATPSNAFPVFGALRDEIGGNTGADAGPGVSPGVGDRDRLELFPKSGNQFGCLVFHAQSSAGFRFRSQVFLPPEVKGRLD